MSDIIFTTLKGFRDCDLLDFAKAMSHKDDKLRNISTEHLYILYTKFAYDTTHHIYADIRTKQDAIVDAEKRASAYKSEFERRMKEEALKLQDPYLYILKYTDSIDHKICETQFTGKTNAAAKAFVESYLENLKTSQPDIEFMPLSLTKTEIVNIDDLKNNHNSADFQITDRLSDPDYVNEICNLLSTMSQTLNMHESCLLMDAISIIQLKTK